jgi:peroxin-14
MPLVAPPTPEKLEQDKKSIEEQFDRAFSLVEQLAKDTEDLKKAEQQRTDRLDGALSELETVMTDLKAANRRREDDAQRVRDEVQALKDSIPKAMNNQKDLTDNRLREINGELASLKTLVTQRMNSNPVSAPINPLRTPSATPTTAGPAAASKPDVPADGASTPAKESPRPAARPGSGLSSGNTGAKASIPAWQMALANQNEGASSTSKSAKVEDEASASS